MSNKFNVNKIIESNKSNIVNKVAEEYKLPNSIANIGKIPNSIANIGKIGKIPNNIGKIPNIGKLANIAKGIISQPKNTSIPALALSSAPIPSIQPKKNMFSKFFEDEESIIHYTPPIVYLLFGIIQFIISLFTSIISYNQFIYLIIVVIFTQFLKKLCIMGYTILAWFFAILPIIFLFIKIILITLMLIGID